MPVPKEHFDSIGIIESAQKTDISKPVSFLLLTIRHFILAMLIINCNISTLNQRNIKIPSVVESIFPKTPGFRK
jgi:hypothetical protein